MAQVDPHDADAVLISLVRRYDEVPWLRETRELIRRWWRIGTIYVDKDNHPIFLSGQPHKLHNRVCAICLASQQGQAHCRESMARAQKEMIDLDQGSLLSFGCHLGMATVTVPIIIEGGRHGGMIYTTGFYDHPPTAEQRDRLVDRGSRINPALSNEEVLSTVPVLTTQDLSRLEDMVRLGITAIVTLFAQLQAKEEEIALLRRQLEQREGFAGLVGSSSVMQEVYRLVEKVAANDCTVLVRGGSGTGKELVAQAIHSQSHRGGGPFVVQNCSAFNANLLESELFGHVRGAFTGAVSDKKGLFEIADGGSLFLDEVAEMSAALQAKLLRVLQDQTFWPVGATNPRKSDVRIVAATHRDLEQMVREERFREDLYYRLNVISIDLPPLKERRTDIPSLIEHFLRNHRGTRISREALRMLSDYDWPGNVRELANEIERMTVLASGSPTLEPELISARIADKTSAQGGPVPRGTLKEAMGALEAQMIGAALKQCNNNRSQAARLLGIARSNLIVKIKAYGLS
jgi:transcriptional regulator with PAS, ATPase and Fis domain